MTKRLSSLEIAVSKLNWFGVDLDHTLIRYNNANLLPLIFTSLGNTLLGLGLVRNLPCFDRHFCSRGLVFDARTGDLLRLDSNGKVCAARHGYASTGILDAASIQKKYGNKWRSHNEILESWKPTDALIMATHFDSPAIQLCALMVDHIDSETTTTSTTTDYSTVLPPLFQAFNANFSPPYFSDGTSEYFNGIKRDPHRYVLPRSTLLPCFRRLRQEHDTKIMIVTNSAHDYASLLLQTAFGEDYLTEFDLIIYNAKKKRGFFKGNSPFLQQGNSGKEWSEGNVNLLHTQFLGGNDQTVLYAGDDVYGDTELVRRHKSEWYTMAIVEEMEHGYLEPKTSRVRTSMWNDTSGILCGIETTPMLDIAMRCDIVCADLYDLCWTEEKKNTMAPMRMLSGHNVQEEMYNTKEEKETEMGKDKEMDKKMDKEYEDAESTENVTTKMDLGNQNQNQNYNMEDNEENNKEKNNKTTSGTVRVVINNTMSIRVKRDVLAATSEYCRASLEWSARSGEIDKSDIPLTVQPASLLLHVPYLLGAARTGNESFISSSSNQLSLKLKMCVPTTTGKVTPETATATAAATATVAAIMHSSSLYSIDVVHLKSLVAQLGMSQKIEDEVRKYIAKTLTPTTALKYLVSASEVYDDELIQLCLSIVAKTASLGTIQSDSYVSDISTLPSLSSDVLCRMLFAMNDLESSSERVMSMYALAWMKIQCTTAHGFHLSNWMDVIIASNVLKTQRRNPNRHPIIVYVRECILIQCPGLINLFEAWLRTNYQQAQLILKGKGPPRGHRTWLPPNGTGAGTGAGTDTGMGIGTDTFTTEYDTNNKDDECSTFQENENELPVANEKTNTTEKEVVLSLENVTSSSTDVGTNGTNSTNSTNSTNGTNGTNDTIVLQPFSSSDVNTIESSYINIFNHVAVKRGWRELPFNVEEMQPVFSMSAAVVGRIREQISLRNSGAFTLTKVSGCSWDYLFSITSGEILLLNNGDLMTMQKIVSHIAKYTLRDANGYVNGVQEEEINDEIERVIESMGSGYR